MSQRKVAHLTSVHHPFDTRIFYKELHSLAAAGYDVVLVAPHEHDEQIDGIRIRAVRKISGKWRRVFQAGWHVIRAALAEDADLYQIHDPELLLWSLLLRVRGKWVVYDMHENVPLDLRNKQWLPRLMRQWGVPVYRLLERILLYRMPVIFAEKSYVQYYPWLTAPHEIILNMPLADALLKCNETPYDQSTIGYIGDVNAGRGSLVTIEALAKLKAQDIAVNWECVGPITPSHRHEIQIIIDTHQLTGVRLHGRLPPAEWHPIIARCHIGLAVLADLPNHRKSYPTKLFEYMGLGIPMITSRFPLYQEVVEGVGCGLTIADPSDAQELADAIHYLLTHPDEAAAMGQRGRAAVQTRYRWDLEAHKLTQFYEQVLEV